MARGGPGQGRPLDRSATPRIAPRRGARRKHAVTRQIESAFQALRAAGPVVPAKVDHGHATTPGQDSPASAFICGEFLFLLAPGVFV